MCFIASNEAIALTVGTQKDEMKIVVLAPHLDDAAFSVSLAITSWIYKGHDVHVVNCFTHSNYAPLSSDFAEDASKLRYRITALRQQEDLNWCSFVGADVVRVDLGLEDAPLRLNCLSDQVCSIALNRRDKAISTISASLQSIAADIFVLPLALGSHIDHLTAREAALPLLNEGCVCAFYEDLPYAARPGVAEQIANVAAQLDLSLRPAFSEEPQDVATAMERKRRLILCYGSQIDEASADEIVQFSARYNGRERLWANDAWFASAFACEA